jgi:hypothetical protein
VDAMRDGLEWDVWVRLVSLGYRETSPNKEHEYHCISKYMNSK